MTEPEMRPMTADQRAALAAAGWTEEDAMDFARALAAFRDGLPPRQREAFDAILAAADGAGREDDVRGQLVVIAIIGILIGPLLPAEPRQSTFPTRVV